MEVRESVRDELGRALILTLLSGFDCVIRQSRPDKTVNIGQSRPDKTVNEKNSCQKLGADRLWRCARACATNSCCRANLAYNVALSGLCMANSGLNMLLYDKQLGAFRLWRCARACARSWAAPTRGLLPHPYTLHPTHCTLHPTPYTLHPTP